MILLFFLVFVAQGDLLCHISSSLFSLVMEYASCVIHAYVGVKYIFLPVFELCVYRRVEFWFWCGV